LNKWIELLADVGRAVLELLEAEAKALQEELAVSGRSYLRVLLLFAVTAAVLFWAGGALTFFLVALVALWLPLWGAALSVGGGLILVGLAVAGVGWWKLRHTERPDGVFRRRFDEHVAWFRTRLLGEDVPERGEEP
jgi:hypothetical protein